MQDGAGRRGVIILHDALRSWAARLTASPGAYALGAGPIALLAVGSPRAAPEWFLALSLVFGALGALLALSSLASLDFTLRHYRAETISFDVAARGMAWAARCGFRASQCLAIALAFGVVATTSLALPGLAVLACLLTPPLAILLAAVPGALRVARHADAALAHVVPARLLPRGGDPGITFRSGWRFDARMSMVRAAVADRSAPLPPEARDIAKALDGGGMIRPPITKLHRDPAGTVRLRVRGLKSVLSASIPVALMAWLVAAPLPPGALPALPRPSDLWSLATPVEPPADTATDTLSALSDEAEADQGSGGNSAGGDSGNGSTTSEGATGGSDAEDTSGDEASGAGADGSAGGSGGDRESGAGQDRGTGAGADGMSQGSESGGEGESGADGGAAAAEGQAEGAGADGPSSGSGSESGGQAGAGERQGAGTDGSSEASGQESGAQPGGGGSGAGDGQGAGGEGSSQGSGQGNGGQSGGSGSGNGGAQGGQDEPIPTGESAQSDDAVGSGAGQGAGEGGSSQRGGRDNGAQPGDGGGTGSGGPQGDGSGGTSRGAGPGNSAGPDGGAGSAEARDVGEGGTGLGQDDEQASEGGPAGDDGSGGGEGQPAGAGGVPQGPGQGGGEDQGSDGAAGVIGTVGAGGASDASARESGEAAESPADPSDGAGSDAEGALVGVALPGQGPDENGPVVVTGSEEGGTVQGTLPAGPATVGGETLSVATPPSLFAAPGAAPPLVLRDFSPESRPEIPAGPAVTPRQRLPAWIADLAQ